MRSVSTADNVVPFRRPAGGAQRRNLGMAQSWNGGWQGATGQSRTDQRNLMEIVYATGSFLLAPEDRDTKLIASRLLVYGFLSIEEVGADGDIRRLRPSEAIRARTDRPWRLTKASYGSSLAVSIPEIDDFLFEPAGRPA